MTAAEPPQGSSAPAWRIIEDGVLAGLVGAVAVALWFLLVDSIRVTPFHTPNLLGSVIFTGASAGSVPPVTLTMVFAYTGLHIVVFLVAGLGAAWIFSVFEDNPQFGMVLLLLVLLFLAVICGLEIAMIFALIGAIVGEFVGAEKGLGMLIQSMNFNGLSIHPSLA